MTSYHHFSSASFADVQFLFHSLYFNTSDIYFNTSDIVEKDTAVKDNVYGMFINHLGTSSVLITISKVALATTIQLPSQVLHGKQHQSSVFFSPNFSAPFCRSYLNTSMIFVSAIASQFQSPNVPCMPLVNTASASLGLPAWTYI